VFGPTLFIRASDHIHQTSHRIFASSCLVLELPANLDDLKTVLITTTLSFAVDRFLSGVPRHVVSKLEGVGLDHRHPLSCPPGRDGILYPKDAMASASLWWWQAR
jgi:hypothetical protein